MLSVRGRVPVAAETGQKPRVQHSPNFYWVAVWGILLSLCKGLYVGVCWSKLSKLPTGGLLG